MIMPNKEDDFPVPEPFIKPCYFCDCDVEMQKDQTEGRPVACFDHSYKFTPKVKK